MFDSTQLIELKLTNCRDWSVLLFRYYTICYITNYRRCRELYHDKNKLSFSINIAVTLISLQFEEYLQLTNISKWKLLFALCFSLWSVSFVRVNKDLFSFLCKSPRDSDHFIVNTAIYKQSSIIHSVYFSFDNWRRMWWRGRLHSCGMSRRWLRARMCSWKLYLHSW